MKRILTIFFALLFIAVICPCVSAEGQSDELDRLKQQIDDRLQNAADSDTSEEIRDMGVTPSDSEGISNIDPKEFFAMLWDKLKCSLSVPLVMLGRILAVSLICVAIEMISSEGTIAKSFSSLSTICVITVIADSLSGSFEALRSSIETINGFMITYIPVFTAVTTAGGHAVTAGAYSASTVLVCEVAELLESRLLLPFLSVITAITIVAAIDPKLKISGAADSVRRLTTWLLATVMLVFVGLMSIQGVTGNATDGLVSRTLRFAASSFIPVIGGSVSDAFLAVKSGVGVIKAAVGGFGLLAVFLIAIRPFLLIVSMKLTLWAAAIVNELLGLQKISVLLKSINSVLSIGVSILIAITSAFLIATAAVMSAAV